MKLVQNIDKDNNTFSLSHIEDANYAFSSISVHYIYISVYCTTYIYKVEVIVLYEANSYPNATRDINREDAK